MKKRVLAVLLALLTLTGCAGLPSVRETPAPEETAEPEQLLSVGTYALRDREDVLSGYLKVARRLITFYDAEGNELKKGNYEFDPGDGLYYIDDAEAFTMETKRKKTWLEEYGTGNRYWLEEIEETAIPIPAPVVTETPEPEELTAEQVYEKAAPSTVDITAIVSDSFYYTGTGFFYDTEGTVITNYHVIDGTRSGFITTSNGREYDILAVLGYDADLDIAILSTGMRDSTPLVRRETPVVTGETVYALGSSLGLTGTFSNGMVSSAQRQDDGHTYIQHTAAISHGNSGGPLLDKKGQVVGINCAYYADGQNLNLAIPIGEVETVSRGSGVTLEQLYTTVYGNTTTATTTSLDTSDWVDVYVAGDGDCYLSASMPEVLYDEMELDEDGTGISSFYSEDNYGVFIAAGIDLGDFSVITEEELGELSDLLAESVRDLGLEPGTVESGSGYINDAFWRVFSTSAMDDEWTVEPYLLVYADEECMIYFIVETAIYGSDPGDDLTSLLANLCYEMISSLVVE